MTQQRWAVELIWLVVFRYIELPRSCSSVLVWRSLARLVGGFRAIHRA